VIDCLRDESVGESHLMAALAVKAMAGQVNVVIHTLGILVSLPYLLEDGELVESLSLGAVNTGRKHDLETNRRIAELKFIEWRGGAESIRQNTLFIDLFGLASSDSSKQSASTCLDASIR
jgi:hypothetical protein